MTVFVKNRHNAGGLLMLCLPLSAWFGCCYSAQFFMHAYQPRRFKMDASNHTAEFFSTGFPLRIASVVITSLGKRNPPK